MAYELSWEPRGVVLMFSGQVSSDDIRNATIDYQRDFRFDDLRYVIEDYLGITGCDANPAEMDYIWALDVAAGISNPKIRRAVIAACPTVIELRLRYMPQDARAFPTEVFASLGDARGWLDIGADQLLPPDAGLKQRYAGPSF